VVDTLIQFIINRSQGSEDVAMFAADQISQLLFDTGRDNVNNNSLLLESLVHVLETLRKISGAAISSRISAIFRQQSGHLFLRMPLIRALAGTDLLDWRSLDAALAKALQQKSDNSLEFLEDLVDLALLGDRPLALYSDFVRTREAAWSAVAGDESGRAEHVKAKLTGSGFPEANVDGIIGGQDQMEYVFDEWVHLCSNPSATEKAMSVFFQQSRVRKVIDTKEDLLVFIRVAIDHSVDLDRVEQRGHSSISSIADGHIAVDALARLIGFVTRLHGPSTSTVSDSAESRSSFFDSVLTVVTFNLHHHQIRRGEHLNQRIFFRLLSMMLHEINSPAQQLPPAQHLDMTIKFATALVNMGPRTLPGFIYAWMSLMQHRMFLPVLLGSNSDVAQAVLTDLVCELLQYVGPMLNAPQLSTVAKELYRAILKLFTILHHDFPDYLASNHMRISRYIPPHCVQLLLIVLSATPASPSAAHDAARGESSDELQEAPSIGGSFAYTLSSHNILDVLNRSLEEGPAEALLAHITHAIGRPDLKEAGFGFAQINANLDLVNAVVMHVVDFAVGRVKAKGGPVFVEGSSDYAVLVLLVRELSTEARYYLLAAMANQLRYANAHTHYFHQLILAIFSQDTGDAEDAITRQQITRILLERLIGYWQLPLGVVVTIAELVKNSEAYGFFDQPCIKASREVWHTSVPVPFGSKTTARANMVMLQVMDRFLAVAGSRVS
jgi:CCR4-NOT transcription complex subunit 1